MCLVGGDALAVYVTIRARAERFCRDNPQFSVAEAMELIYDGVPPAAPDAQESQSACSAATQANSSFSDNASQSSSSAPDQKTATTCSAEREAPFS